jgi:hypothetical protein
MVWLVTAGRGKAVRVRLVGYGRVVARRSGEVRMAGGVEVKAVMVWFGRRGGQGGRGEVGFGAAGTARRSRLGSVRRGLARRGGLGVVWLAGEARHGGQGAAGYGNAGRGGRGTLWLGAVRRGVARRSN